MAEEISHIRLSELASKVRAVINNAFSGQFYWVVAEISGHKFYVDSNRHYLDLVEKIEGQSTEAAKIKTTVWAEGAKKIIEFEQFTGQKFSDGLQVLVKVRVEYHIVYGLSLVISDIDQSFTLGNLERQRLQTLHRLEKENPGKIYREGDDYVTANKLLKLNSVLQRIALVASPNSEGYHDFISNIGRNKFGYKFHIDHFFSSVQGMAAEEELKNTMVKIFETGKAYDCVVIIRGGGAKTDFLAFDTYGIARAVARFPIPVITGIGHLRDVSITDMMAHTATNAPTKAAEFVVYHNRSFEEHVLQLQKSIIIKTQQCISSSQQKINSCHSSIINKSRNILIRRNDNLVRMNQAVINKSKSILFDQKNFLVRAGGQITSRPFITVKNKINDLNNIHSNLKSFSSKFLLNQQGYLNHYTSIVKLMSPKNILKKGFAIVKVDGKIVKDAGKIAEGNELNITLSDAELKTKVISKNKLHGNENEL